MAVTLERLLQEALDLPDESKASLAERLVAFLQSHMDPDLQREHLAIVNKRREQLLSGAVRPIPGPEALRAARRKLGQ